LITVVADDIHSLVSLLTVAQGTDAGALVLQVWLANLMLAIFNLLPAFPMDGGGFSARS
jgi:Zn-dependent protease